MQKQRYSRELAAYTLMQWDKAHLPADRRRKSEAPQKILRRNSNNHESHTPSRRTSECRPPGTLLCHISHASKDSLITIDRLENLHSRQAVAVKKIRSHTLCVESQLASFPSQSNVLSRTMLHASSGYFPELRRPLNITL